MTFSPTHVTITDPAMLIRIPKLYRTGMSVEALYEAARGVWVVGVRRNAAKYAMVVHDGTVREVYAIEAWHPAGTTVYHFRPDSAVKIPRRWEFTGVRAPDDVRDRYVGKSVAGTWKRGASNPIRYANC